MNKSASRLTCLWFAVQIVCALAMDWAPLFAAGAEKKPATAAKPVFRAGAATSNITPWLGDGIVGGWSAPPAKHVHDELHARCLVLDDGATRIALVVADSVGIPREVFDEAKRQIHEHTGLPVDRLLMSASHTHSATSSRPRNGLAPDRPLADYPQFLARRIADGVRRAINNLEPARVGWGVAEVPGQVFNRRWLMKPGTPAPNPFGGQDQARMNPGQQNPGLWKPAGPVDPQVCFLSVRAVEGRPIALVANYSLHYVGDVPGGMVSADYFGEFCRQVEARLAGGEKPPPLAILTNGSSGDVNNVDFRNPRKPGEVFSRIRHVAGRVAEAALKVHGQTQFRDGLPLAMAERDIELAVRKPGAAELERAKQILARPDDKGLPRLARYYSQQAVRLSQYPNTLKVKLQAVRIGDVAIAAIPCEVFAEIGLEIKKRSPVRPTFVIELANGYHGYLPTPEQHAVGGYETWAATSSYLEVNASRKITATVLELLGQVVGAPAKHP